MLAFEQGLTKESEGKLIPALRGAGGGCFVAGTPVVMASGVTQAIETVAKGLVVRSRDQDDRAGDVLDLPVSGPVSLAVDRTMKIRLAKAEGGDDGTWTLHTTGAHPFYRLQPEAGWTFADCLHAGDRLAGLEEDVLVTGLERAGPAEVYNFTVEGSRTYFVRAQAADGALGPAVWTHNDGCMAKRLQDKLEPHEAVLRDLMKIDPSDGDFEKWAKVLIEARKADDAMAPVRSKWAKFEPERMKPKPEGQSVIDFARSNQGNRKYPGVDDWSEAVLQEGSLIAGLAPGQTNFYTTIEMVKAAGLSRSRLSLGMQVAPHDTEGFRRWVTIYKVKRTTPAAIGKALANGRYGSGGFDQLVVPNPLDGILEPIIHILLEG